MSLSDKFYEGLSAPVPVVGAQLPDDMTMYAGGPYDPLKQHEQKYKQQEYMQRLSDQASMRLLEELSKEDEMDKISFVGSDPLNRRAYYLEKLAERPLSSLQQPPTPAAREADGGDYEFSDAETGIPDPLPTPQVPSTPVQSPLNTAPASAEPQPSLRPTVSSEPLKVPATFPDPREPLKVPTNLSRSITPKYKGYGERYMGQAPTDPRLRYVGKGRQDLVNSGEMLNRLHEFSDAYGSMEKDPRLIQAPVDNRGFFERLGDGLYYYGSKAAKGLSTGAQMGASYLYDRLGKSYLGQGSYLGDLLGQSGRESLNKEMARINASLAHSYGYSPGNTSNPDAALYARRLQGIDTDLTTDAIEAREDLLDRQKFIDQLALDRLGTYPADTKARETRLQELRDSVRNYYGFDSGISQTPQRKAMNPIMRAITSPTAETERLATLEEIMKKDPGAIKTLQATFGEQAQKAGKPLAQYVAERLGRGLDFNKQVTSYGDTPSADDDVYETDEEVLQRYNENIAFADDVLGSISEEDLGNFITQMNPSVIQRAQEISTVMDKDPEKALAIINEMDPEEARYLLDQISMLSKYVSPQTKQRIFDPDKYQVREDRDDFLPSIGGVDLVNPALQQIGAGSGLNQMTGDARDPVYFYNSMRDAPASEGRYYLVDDGYLSNLYYNPTTGETNREFITDFGGKLNPFYDASAPLPRKYHKQFREQFGHSPNYR